MKHPDWPAFVAAIVADPDDDTARLVAADFLEENGEVDRATFIRIQVALARLEAGGQGKSLDADHLRAKERAFLNPLDTCRTLWGAEECPELVRIPPDGRNTLKGMRVDGADRLTWRRGFVEVVRCPAAMWLKHGREVRIRNPIRAVALTECQHLTRDHWYAMFPALTGLRGLTLAAGDNENLATWLRTLLPGVQVVAASH